MPEITGKYAQPLLGGAAFSVPDVSVPSVCAIAPVAVLAGAARRRWHWVVLQLLVLLFMSWNRPGRINRMVADAKERSDE